ncbi:MAG: hypothetical protein J6P02_03820 [Lachnospiraceae bacterium]|nr:hypothetical protein [Lachnospiraceae bacterium]
MVNGVVFQKKYINNNNLITNNNYQKYIKRIFDSGYKGIEGDNWYLNSDYSEIFDDFFDYIDEESFYNDDFTGVLYDDKMIQKYIDISKKESIEYRILLCETKRNKPQALNLKWKRKIFLGYDYAYPGPDYYSAVFEDICIEDRKINLGFTNFKLNNNKLFETYDLVNRFAIEREKVLKSDNGQYLEKGKFIIYKLYEVEDLIL